MKKISYWSKIDKPLKPEKNPPIGLIGEDSATENAGRGGFSALEMTTEPLMLGGTDPDHYEEGNPSQYKSSDDIMGKELLDMLLLLGDEMDSSGEEALANFAAPLTSLLQLP